MPTSIRLDIDNYSNRTFYSPELFDDAKETVWWAVPAYILLRQCVREAIPAGS